MICVEEPTILARAKQMPVGYLADCRAAARIDGGIWCFGFEDFFALRRKYAGYAPSDAHPVMEHISGCCDRADQF